MRPEFNERSLDRGEIESIGDELLQKPIESPLTGINSRENLDRHGPLTDRDNGTKINVSSPTIAKQNSNGGNERTMNMTHNNNSGDSL